MGYVVWLRCACVSCMLCLCCVFVGVLSCVLCCVVSTTTGEVTPLQLREYTNYIASDTEGVDVNGVDSHTH